MKQTFNNPRLSNHEEKDGGDTFSTPALNNSVKYFNAVLSEASKET